MVEEQDQCGAPSKAWDAYDAGALGWRELVVAAIGVVTCDGLAERDFFEDQTRIPGVRHRDALTESNGTQLDVEVLLLRVAEETRGIPCGPK